MDKHHKAAALTRIANFYRLKDRNRRILEKLGHSPYVGERCHSRARFHSFTKVVLESPGRYGGTYFEEFIAPTINGVSAKHWDAFWEAVRQSNGWEQFTNQADSLTWLALPGLDQERLAHLSNGWDATVTTRVLEKLVEDSPNRLRDRALRNFLVDQLAGGAEALSPFESDELLRALKDPGVITDLSDAVSVVAFRISHEQLSA